MSKVIFTVTVYNTALKFVNFGFFRFKIDLFYAKNLIVGKTYM